MQPKSDRPFHNIAHDNNMGIVRYYLSIYVVIAHAVTLGRLDLTLPFSTTAIVGSFFALSGFLLFPSFQKKQTWRHYVSRRARRILPPYFLIVILCALLLSAVSQLPLQEYFSNSGLWKYLAANLSFMNFAHPDLPGVFIGDQYVTSAVNGSLWTMKGEWACYLSVPFVFLAIKKYPHLGGIILLSIIAFALVSAATCYHLEELKNSNIYGIIGKQFGHLLVYFYIGALINYYYPVFIKYRWYIPIICIGLIVFGDYIPQYYLIIQPFATSALTLWASMTGKWGVRLSRHDNVSYDIYLFHFPIIQLLVYYGIADRINPILFIILSIALTAVLAVISWNLVGKRFSKSKPSLPCPESNG